MANTKKYLITAITLGLIATGSALLIAGTNMITRDKIAANEQKKINEGLASIYDVKVDSLNSNLVELPKDKEFTYVSGSYYEVKNESNEPLGYAFKTNGSNSYGKISLIIGFSSDKSCKGLSVVINEQSFATTLEDNYLTPLSEGKREIEDVKCGATYGATLVKDMINEAKGAVSPSEGEQNG